MSEKWTSGKPFVATADHCAAKWNCGKPGEHFKCALCGHKFLKGEVVRWQYTNDVPGAGGNPFVCKTCDIGRDGIIAEILKRRAELRSGAWEWFVRLPG